MLREWAELVVARGVVPALLVVGMLSAGICAGQVWPGARSAAYGGFWFGVLGVAAVVLALTRVELGELPATPACVPPLAGLLGLFAGAWTTWFYLRWRRRWLVALPLAWQSFGALALLYLYAVWEAVRDYVGWLAVGIAAASSVFYALGRDLRPKSRKAPSTTVPAAPSEPSRVADRWYQQRPWRRQRPSSTPPTHGRRLGAGRRRLPPSRTPRPRRTRAEGSGSEA